MAWRFDESTAKPMQDLKSIGLDEKDVSALTHAFLLCGFWRAALNDGLMFFTEHTFTIFEMTPHDGPVNITSIMQTIHADDRSMLLDAFQRSIETQQTFHCIYRIKTKEGGDKWIRTVGIHREGQDGRPELRGMTHALFQHVATAAFAVDPAPPPSRLP